MGRGSCLPRQSPGSGHQKSIRAASQQFLEAQRVTGDAQKAKKPLEQSGVVRSTTALMYSRVMEVVTKSQFALQVVVKRSLALKVVTKCQFALPASSLE